MKIITYKNTVQEVLDTEKISLDKKDKISPALDTKIFKNSQITIKRAVNIKVSADGKIYAIKSAEKNIEAMLDAEGIKFKPEDKINLSLDSKLTEGMNIAIVRVDARTSIETLAINFTTIVEKNSGLPNTYRKTTQEGQKGVEDITTTIIYENNKEVSRKVKKVISKSPIEKIIVQGTYPLMPVDSNGQTMSYRKVLSARATAYSAIRGIGKTYTSSGSIAVRNPDGYSTIAVDPSVIPMGSRLFVEGYGFAIAADTGTGIIGNSIDVFFNTYQESCDWAVKQVHVYILN